MQNVLFMVNCLQIATETFSLVLQLKTNNKYLSK